MRKQKTVNSKIVKTDYSRIEKFSGNNRGTFVKQLTVFWLLTVEFLFSLEQLTTI